MSVLSWELKKTWIRSDPYGLQHDKNLLTMVDVISQLRHNYNCVSSANECIVTWCLLVRPKTIVFGRTYVLLQMFFFSRREISEMRGPTDVKFCTMVSTRPYFITPVQNFWGAHPKKISGAKNMQNLARFRTTWKFGSEYLRKGWRYSKSSKSFRLSRFLLR